MTSDDLATWLRQQLDRREAIARAASEPYVHRDDQSVGAPPEGCHWQWVVGENWTPTVVDPAVDETVGGPDEYGCDVNLTTVETWESSVLLESGERIGHRQMPSVAANSIVEMRSTWALHIATNDPDAVLADIAAKRAILDLHFTRDGTGGTWDTDPKALCNECEDLQPCRTVKLLTSAYALRDGYREEWRP